MLGIGGGGIRTPETVSRLTVFKTVAFSRSAMPPVCCGRHFTPGPARASTERYNQVVNWNWTIFLRGMYVSLGLPALGYAYMANCGGGLPLIQVPGHSTGFSLFMYASAFLSYAFFGLLVSIFFMWKTTPPNTCRQCSYNLTGNTSGICPECGTLIKDNTP